MVLTLRLVILDLLGFVEYNAIPLDFEKISRCLLKPFFECFFVALELFLFETNLLNTRGAIGYLSVARKPGS